MNAHRHIKPHRPQPGSAAALAKCIVGGLLLMLVAGLDTLHGQQRIMSPGQRQEVLDKAQHLLDRETVAPEIDFSQIKFPFAFPQPDEPEEELRETAAPKDLRPPDAEVLRALAERIRPTGTAVRGDRSFLIFSQGQVPQGGTIGLTYRNEYYRIQVDEISLQTNSYRLRLNEETLIPPLSTRTSTGTVERD